MVKLSREVQRFKDSGGPNAQLKSQENIQIMQNRSGPAGRVHSWRQEYPNFSRGHTSSIWVHVPLLMFVYWREAANYHDSVESKLATKHV